MSAEELLRRFVNAWASYGDADDRQSEEDAYADLCIIAGEAGFLLSRSPA